MRRHHCPHCGCEIDDERRSSPQHRRYMGLVKAAFEHWPDTHPFKPMTQHHLRKWLEVMAGHRTVKHIQAPTILDPAVTKAFVRSLFREADTFVFMVVSGSEIVLHVPKSIRYSQLGHKAACRLFQEVEAIVQDVIGVTGDQLLNARAA